MTTYFEAPDGHGEPTLWFVEDNRPAEVLTRKRNIHDGHWPDVVTRMTGTTIIQADDATVQKVAQVINDEGGRPGNSIHSWRCEYPDRYSPCGCVETTAKLILAALTGGAT